MANDDRGVKYFALEKIAAVSPQNQTSRMIDVAIERSDGTTQTYGMLTHESWQWLSRWYAMQQRSQASNELGESSEDDESFDASESGSESEGDGADQSEGDEEESSGGSSSEEEEEGHKFTVNTRGKKRSHQAMLVELDESNLQDESDAEMTTSDDDSDDSDSDESDD
jgi:hypothetical protein